jgi:outer membrane protein insertion porin family/translocation and assembly module TamA
MALLPAVAAAQTGADQSDSPRVTRVTFNGSSALDRRQLLRSIHTQPTRCRALLLKPFCLISNADIFEETQRLDSLEMHRDGLRLRVRYFQRGYREAEVTARVVRHGGGAEVIFDIREGAPTVIAANRIEQSGTVLSPAQLSRAAFPAVGRPLDLILLDSALIRLREQLDAGGYLDALVDDTVLVMDHSAEVQVQIDPKQRATLRDVVIEGNKTVSDRVIRTALDIRPGDVLRSDRLYGSQRNLYQSNLFRLARVAVAEQPDSAKTVAVAVMEAPHRTWTAGVGINTVDFVQAEAGFTHYNYNGSGGTLDVKATLGNLLASQLSGSGMFIDVSPSRFFIGDDRVFVRPTWEVSVTVAQPGFNSSYRNTVAVSGFAHRRTLPGVAVDRGYGAGLSLTRKLDPRTPASLTYDFEITTVEAGDVYYCINHGVCELNLIDPLRQGQRLSPAAISIFADHADRPMSPSSGFHFGLDAEHASALTFSDFRYNRAQVEFAYYMPLAVRRVVAGRIRAGWVAPLASTGEAVGLGRRVGVLHPRKRFYAGGSRSVRGYGENQLGPRILTISPEALMDTATAACTQAQIANGSCDPNPISSTQFQPRPLGGRQSIEANLEYRFPLFGQVDGAAFVDMGWVGAGADTVAPARGAITPGVGVRYQSPIGPIRIDLGLRPTTAEDLPVVTEFEDADGIRRMVRLATLKRYDQLEDARGFRKILNRLTLHLSIGQAF